MRKQYLAYFILVFGIVGVAYGTHLLVYHFNHGNGLSIPALLLLVFGSIALVLVLTLLAFDYFAKKKKKSEPVVIEEVKPIEEEKPVVKEEVTSKPEVKVEQSSTRYEYTPKEKDRVSYSVPSTVYVKQVGYGPILRVEGSRILDMRSNTYYRFENNILYQEGSGPVFEIRGNQIKNAFGGFLYEISGSNINKVYGGFYASISGNYITLFDLSVKYEMTDSLSKKQLLAVAALLFGKY